ncbi:hypothetical protein EUGRSUZ_K01879 [Eucalyptus grandis]|uniref:Rx N-terminal domain-containing protein n=2 Tax=Eucalyptus grandis TaxID=71139 RepID=A0A059A200_EUCGR|nr:hypothetical protein EUGRSUZ_K01879 [Eucalyptus grandis]
MADLLSMGEGVLKKIASLALVEAVAIYGVEDQISELRETLSYIKAKLSDAEKQQGKNHCQQVWLDQLEDIFYDAEDLLDELECEASRKKVISRYGGIKEKVSFSFSDRLIFRDKLSHKVKEINERLSKISYDKSQFDLNLESTDDDMAHMKSQEVTYSYVHESDVIGRDADKKKIIEMLMQPTDDKNLSVIPIVGMGGLGKTDLAKLVYYDRSVQAKFELRLWVWVSKDFDLKKIIERIIEGATGHWLSNLDIEQLRPCLQETIKDKTFLLVLDDVWRDVCCEDFCRWKELRDLLRVGASESKIIVTRRDSKVASTIGTHRPYNLEGLSHESFMVLFKRCASSGEEKEPRTELLEIVNYNVEKSQGMPLLAVILGNLLPREEEEWYGANMRDREARELVEVKILPRLKLSYDDLPIHLKRCFSILSLFPKGQKIKAGKLIRLWVALGLIIPTKEKQKPEDIGVDYVKDLGQRSLIQEIEEYGSVLSFKVPDLVHSLATTVGRKYCSTVDLNPLPIPESVRYISIPTTSLEEIPDYDGVPPFLRNKTSKKLRAIMIQSQVDERVITRKFARTCISKCNHLRYLDLSYGSFEKLPSSIGNVKQLRSLILSKNKQLKKLPDAVCELQNLLHLDVSGCSELDELPKNMKWLVNLMYLYITTKQKSLQESGIQYLKNLKFLGLKACQNLQVLFKGAYRLTGLQELLIKNCGRLISVPFGELISLERLSIERCPLMLIQKKTSFPSRLCVLSIASLEQVMELLQRLNESAYTLKSLCIRDCPNFTALPEWLPNYTCLKEICLIQCPNLASMPQGIQSLTTLKELHILYCGLAQNCSCSSNQT